MSLLNHIGNILHKQPSDSNCTDLNIPSHLHTNNRPNIQNFSATENVYRRFPPNGYDGQDYVFVESDGTKKVLPHVFHHGLHEMSVVREKYSKNFKDALYRPDNKSHYFNWGVAQLKLSDFITNTFPTDNGEFFSLTIEHTSYPCIYPHSDICVLKNGEKIIEIKPKALRTKIKNHYSNIAKLVKDVDS